MAAVAVPQFRRLVVEIEHFPAAAQDQPVGLLPGRLGGRHLRGIGKTIAQKIDPIGQFTAGLLPLIVYFPVDDPLHLETGRVGIAAGGERFVRGTQEPFLGKPPRRLQHYHVGRNQPLVLVLFEVGEYRADTGVGQPPARQVTGLHQVRGGLVAVVAVRHAADQGELVGLPGQFREQEAELHGIDASRNSLVEFTHEIVA